MTDEYSLIMPFVACQTHGGPYDDNAYVAGYEMGLLDRTLSTSTNPLIAFTQLIHTDNEHQADLVAMRHGFTMKVRDQDGEWSLIELSPTQEQLNRRDAGERRRDV